MELSKRLGFSTLGCPGWDLSAVVDNAAEMGFSAIEIRGIGSQLDTVTIDALMPDRRADTGRLFQKNGLVISDIASSVQFDGSSMDKALEEGYHTIALCDEMDIMGFRVFADHRPENDWAGTIACAAEGLSALCERAASSGDTQVLLEVHGAFNTIECFEQLLLKLAQYRNFGIIWDIQHSFRVYGNDFLPFYQVIRPYIRHVHIKDCRVVDGKAEICPVGEGDIDIPAIVQRLEAEGYGGYYAFEWEKRWHPAIPEPEIVFPQYIRYMRAL